jgi:hypothetical protein
MQLTMDGLLHFKPYLPKFTTMTVYGCIRCTERPTLPLSLDLDLLLRAIQADPTLLPAKMELRQQKGDKNFRNCIQFDVATTEQCRMKVVKLFKNGTVQVTGIHNPHDVSSVFQMAIQCLHAYDEDEDLFVHEIHTALFSINIYLGRYLINKRRLQHVCEERDVLYEEVEDGSSASKITFSTNPVIKGTIHETGQLILHSNSPETVASTFEQLMSILDQPGCLTLVTHENALVDPVKQKRRIKKFPLLSLAQLSPGLVHDHLPLRDPLTGTAILRETCACCQRLRQQLKLVGM